MNRPALILSAALALTGCSAHERQMSTDFLPAGDQFTYSAIAYATSQADDPAAEAQRIEWLEDYLKMNAMCVRGYEVTERRAVLIREAMLGPVHKVHYAGRCAS